MSLNSRGGLLPTGERDDVGDPRKTESRAHGVGGPPLRAFLCQGVLACLFLAFACTTPGPKEKTEHKTGEAGASEVREECVSALLFGWGKNETRRFHYVLPFYYHTWNEEKEKELNLFFPLLSAGYSGPLGAQGRARGALMVPLLAFAGSGERDGGREASGWISPYLAVGSVRFTKGDRSLDADGLALFPWIPLVDDLFSVHLYTAAGGGGAFDRMDTWACLDLPVLQTGLLRAQNAGIEEDFRFLYLWSTTLYRRSLDLPGGGINRGTVGLDTTEVLRDAVALPRAGEEDRDAALLRLDALERILGSSRSGAPKEHMGVLDPLLTLEVEGEEISAVGLEPLFFYDREEGCTLAPLLLTLGGEGGVRFGGPAFRHLYPLVHGNREGTRYDFLAGLGTWMREKDYKAVDLKLLFNYQRGREGAYSWGALPYFFGARPARPFRRDVRFLQLPGWIFSGWHVEDERGFEVLPPFLFSWTANGAEQRIRVLLLFRYTWREKASAFDLLGLTLFRSGKEENP